MVEIWLIWVGLAANAFLLWKIVNKPANSLPFKAALFLGAAGFFLGADGAGLWVALVCGIWGFAAGLFFGLTEKP